MTSGDKTISGRNYFDGCEKAADPNNYQLQYEKMKGDYTGCPEWDAEIFKCIETQDNAAGFDCHWTWQ